MRTLLWSYLGWRRFPRDMSAFEVRHCFSFSVADRRELRVCAIHVACAWARPCRWAPFG
jgi:hypothetical protein